MINLRVNNESANLKLVLLGIPNDFGGTPEIHQCYDPKSLSHVINGNFPCENDIINEMNNLLSILEKHKVKVLRPVNIPDVNQIFARDIAFVIEDKIILPNIIEERKREMDAISDILGSIDDDKILLMPPNSRAEGGDVIVWNEYIFIGFSDDIDFNKYKVSRTNNLGVEFIKSQFKNKKIMQFELNKSDLDPRSNSLHLDCCFQPFGMDKAIIYKKGFKNYDDVDFLINFFSKENIIFIDTEEMYNMKANIFSISEKTVISDKNFIRLNSRIREMGIDVEEVSYSEISKMGGLFRCSTMPLVRE
tara:strand:- start:2434 stop:3348 length:915 start_codon:yes stop_codon:yes gene_type:complete